MTAFALISPAQADWSCAQKSSAAKKVAAFSSFVAAGATAGIAPHFLGPWIGGFLGCVGFACLGTTMVSVIKKASTSEAVSNRDSNSFKVLSAVVRDEWQSPDAEAEDQIWAALQYLDLNTQICYPWGWYHPLIDLKTRDDVARKVYDQVVTGNFYQENVSYQGAHVPSPTSQQATGDVRLAPIPQRVGNPRQVIRQMNGFSVIVDKSINDVRSINGDY